MSDEKKNYVLKASVKDIYTEFESLVDSRLSWILEVKKIQQLERIADILERIENHQDKVGVKR